MKNEPSPDTVRLIAFYLPQFHPIPENDLWWGKGFTEWSNVARAQPLFAGHYQPHLPGDLGFYDLRLPEAREAQANLAREYGIHGFCYYHYWFNGKRLLGRPLDEVLSTGRPDFPLCLCWANENWTRAWDGRDSDLLTKQAYNIEDDREHMRWLARALRDPRYIRVDGKPLLLVYRVSELPSAIRTAAIWRDEAMRTGIGNIFLATVESLQAERIDPTRLGFDGAVEFQPDWLNLGTPREQTIDGLSIYDYSTVVESMRAKASPPYRCFRSVATGWDNTPRRRQNAFVLRNATPERYQEWLEHAISVSQPSADGNRLVFVNAWNEWAEGAHLEPCQKWGRAYLEASRTALARARPHPQGQSPIAATLRSSRKVTVCIPTYNGERYLAPAITSVLAQTFRDFELVIVDDCSTDRTREVALSFDDSRIRFVPGARRVGLVANWNRAIAQSSSEFVSLFHQDDLMARDNLERKLSFLENHPTAGMVHSNVSQIGPRDETLSKWWYFEPTAADNGLHRGTDFFSRLLSGPNIVCCPSVVVRGRCFEELGPFDSTLPFTTDLEMWLRISLFYDVGYLTDTLVRYRRHEANETNSFLGAKELEHRYAAKKRVLQKYPERIADRDRLGKQLARQYKDLALERAEGHLAERRYDEARKSLTLAIELHADAANEPLDSAYKAWLLEILERTGRAWPEALRNRTDPRRLTELEDALERERLNVIALRNSMSWRVTRPLRRLYEIVMGSRPGG